MNEILQIINTVGFPIFVAVYMLIFMRQTIDKLNTTIDKLNVTIELLKKDMEARLQKIESILEKKI